MKVDHWPGVKMYELTCNKLTDRDGHRIYIIYNYSRTYTIMYVYLYITEGNIT